MNIAEKIEYVLLYMRFELMLLYNDVGIFVKEIEELPYDFLYSIGIKDKHIENWNSVYE